MWADAMRAIRLTQGLVALVDAADYESIAAKRWCASRHRNTFYAKRHFEPGASRKIYMHREVLGLTYREIHVDHRNGNGLDNRRSNLRIASGTQNNANQKAHTATSRFKGVCLDPERGLWRANIQSPRGQEHLGYFRSEVEAARAYDIAAVEIYGEFARPNFEVTP